MPEATRLLKRSLRWLAIGALALTGLAAGLFVIALLVNLHDEPLAPATRALLKGARWVETNPVAAAKLSVEKKYLASNPELNALAISHLRYIPSVSGAEEAVKSAAVEMKRAGMLNPTTDVPTLAKSAFVHLEGVSDKWLQSLQVERLAGGQLPPDQKSRVLAECAGAGVILNVASCCSPATK